MKRYADKAIQMQLLPEDLDVVVNLDQVIDIVCQVLPELGVVGASGKTGKVRHLQNLAWSYCQNQRIAHEKKVARLAEEEEE
jgi:hypothetical protein